MLNHNDGTKRVQNGFWALVIMVFGMAVSVQGYACFPPEVGDIVSVAGGVIGSVFAPGAGTVIGGTVGGMAGKAISCPQEGGTSPSPQPAPTPDSGMTAQDILQNWKEQHKDALEAEKQMVDRILQSNDRQVTQLLQMHQNDLNKTVESNERIVTSIQNAAREKGVLDNGTIKSLLQRQDKADQGHRDEIDRLVKQYNDKLGAADKERTEALQKLENMMTSLNSQIILAQLAHVACSRATDNHTWCVTIRHRNNPEKCADLDEKRRVFCE